MECWILFHREDYDTAEEAGCYEIRRIREAGTRAGVNIQVFTPERFHLVTSHTNNISVLLDGAEIETLPDVLLPRLGVLSSYFTLSIIRQFERMGVLVFNGAGTISTVMDKMRTQQVLAHAGISVPKTMLARFPVDVDLVERTLGFPVVVKAISGTQGQGVLLSETPQQFKDIMHLVEESNPTAQIIFQEFIAETRGRDLRAFVIDGKIAGCMQRKAADGGFKANISNGGTGEAFALDAVGQDIALRTAKVLGLDIAGIDLLFSAGGYMVCEANSAPDFAGMEKYCHVKIAEEIVAAMKRRAARRRRPKIIDDTRKFFGALFTTPSGGNGMRA
ncbi:MAG TPA: RimK family alpha-L-glutamate ligase [Alphaproteobacteria bacterium]|jgi:gamma-F420-2:alpha-L-glutamate ligase